MDSFPSRAPVDSPFPGQSLIPPVSRPSALAAWARVALCLGAFVPFLSVPAQADGTSAAVANGQYAAGELLVKFKDGPNSAAAAKLRAQFGATAVKSFSRTGWQRIKLPAGVTTLNGLSKFAGVSGVASVEPNFRRYPTKTPNDPYYSFQYMHSHVHTPAAWDVNTGTQQIVVAVLDSGVNLEHEDLQGRLVGNPYDIPDNKIDDDGNGYVDDTQGWDFADDDDDPNDDGADPGHGTHCAGVIGATGDNNLGVTGINWNVRILPLRFLGDEGGTLADEIAAYEYMIDLKKRGMNIRIASCSYGGTTRSSAEQDAIIAAGQAGILTVAAAGNGNDRGVGINNDVAPHYPSSFETDYILSVAASDESDNPTRFTNYGASSVDIAAPGENILSTYAGDEDSYAFLSGTSMATPVVAGAAALVLAQHPEYSPIELKRRLMSTVTKFPQWKGRIASGGIVNVANAVGGILNLTGSVYSTATGSQMALPGATVSIAETNSSTTTDSSGSYSFGALTSGTYTVTVSLSGYQTQTQTITLSAADGSLDFDLVPNPATYSISGRVTLEGTATGLEGVDIYLNGSTVPSATTSSSGTFLISNLSGGNYTISAAKDRYTITVSTDSSSDEVSIELPTVGEATSPSGVVNFVASYDGPDQTPPEIFIDSPADGDVLTFKTGGGVSTTSMGSATDETGIASLSFVLARQNGRKLQYYNWTKRSWVGKDTVAGVRLTRNVSGLTEMGWSQILPKLAKGSYILTVSGTDTLGNSTDGVSDAVSAFSVEKQAKSNGNNGVSVGKS